MPSMTVALEREGLIQSGSEWDLVGQDDSSSVWVTRFQPSDPGAELFHWGIGEISLISASNLLAVDAEL